MSILRNTEDSKIFQNHEKWALIAFGKVSRNVEDGSLDISAFFYPYEKYKPWLKRNTQFASKEVRSTKINITKLSKAAIGDVYDNEGNLYKKNRLINKSRQQLYITENLCHDKISSHSEANLILKGFPFLEPLKNSPFITIEKNDKIYLIPSYVIASYFFFHSSTFVSQIFNNTYLENASLIKAPYKDAIANKLTVDINFTLNYPKKVKQTLAWILCAQPVEATVQRISSTLQLNLALSLKSKFENSKNTAYFECPFPVLEKLGIYFSYCETEVEGKIFCLVTEILDSKESKIYFERIRPFVEVQIKSRTIKNDIPTPSNNSKPGHPSDDVEIEFNNQEIEERPAINPSTTNGEAYFDNIPIEFEPPIYKPNEDSEAIKIEVDIQPNPIPFDSLENNGDLPPSSDGLNDEFNGDLEDLIVEDNKFYKDFYEMLIQLKKHSWDIKFIKYQKPNILYKNSISKIKVPDKTSNKKYVIIIARIIHKNDNGAFYLLENGIQDNPKNHYTSLINYPNFENLKTIDIENIITAILSKQGHWTAIKHTYFFNKFCQKSFEHQKKGSLHFAMKINNYISDEFCSNVPKIKFT